MLLVKMQAIGIFC